jgi:hypothetical protein
MGVVTLPLAGPWSREITASVAIEPELDPDPALAVKFTFVIFALLTVTVCAVGTNV